MKSRGALIVFEGLDRSGKSTQCKKLVDTINDTLKMKAELWKYPNRATNIGKLINEYLSNQKDINDNAVHLLFSANRWESVDEMKKKLYSGCNLVIDRYAYSGTAYTAAKEGMDLEWCKKCDEGLPKPDIVFFLDTSSDVLKTRNEFGAERYEKIDFQNIVYKNFRKFFPEKNPESSNFYVINAADTIDNLHERIVKKTLEVIENCKYKDLQNLW
jgi:dTMP kinase